MPLTDEEDSEMEDEPNDHKFVLSLNVTNLWRRLKQWRNHDDQDS